MPIESFSSRILETNLTKELSKEALTEIGMDVVEGYDVDERSREKWRENVREYMKLASQIVEPKNYPWPKAANIKYPLLTEAATQFASRAYPSLLPGVDIVRGRVIGFDETGEKEKTAIRIGKHMSYQLLEEMEEWEDDMDKLCNILPIVGCVFKKTYYSPLKGRNVSELVLPEDLVVNYWSKSLEESERITHVIELSKNAIEARVRSGIFNKVTLTDPTKERPLRELQDEIIGLDPTRTDDTKPFVVLEQHTWLDLDEDGYKEPYIVTVLYDTGEVLRIVTRFDETGIQHAAKGTISNINPINYFTKFGFIPNPDGGFYDIGFGQLLGPINSTIDSTINQLLDSGTLSNMPSGFLARGVKIKKGEARINPGEWISVQSTGDDLRKGIVPLPVKEPSPTLFQLLGLMIGAGEKLAGTMDSLVGENPGQNQKATTTLAVIEQGMKVFNSIYKRLHRSLKKEYKKLYNLNRIYLQKETYFTVLDPMNETADKIFRSDYEQNIADVIPGSDPNVATEQQRLAKAVGLLELLQLGTINPAEATRRILEAQGQHGIEQLMAVQPQPNPEIQLKASIAQDESERAWAALQLEEAKVKAQVLTATANAIKLVADAEATKEGSQLEYYKAQVAQFMQQSELFLKSLETGGKLSEQRAARMAQSAGSEGVSEGAV